MATYMIQDTTLTNIAEAIREKTSITAQMLPTDMPRYIRNIQTTSSGTTGIPSDIVNEANRVVNSMASKIGSNSLTFVAMSDMHEMGDGDHTNSVIVERYRRANLNAGQAAKLISDSINLDFFAHLGDFAWGANTTTIARGVQSIRQGREYIADVVRNNESFITPGNHDCLAYSYSVNNECLSYGVMEGLIGTYRYKDFDSKKVRVICLNTADNNGAVSSKERISGTQLQWFAESLDLSEKSDASDWSIVILSHHPLDWGEIKVAANCLAAYLEGTQYSVTHNGVAVAYNFSGRNSANVIAQFHGHVHGFRVDYINDLRTGVPVPTTVKRIAIPNACFGRNNEYGRNSGKENNGIEFGDTSTYDKLDNSTGKNTSFCVVSIDLDKKIIYADCFGAGYDRVVSYTEEVIVTYNVTNNLINAINSNGATTVVEGANYTATIVANSGYVLDDVTVTMGGVDITATAVSGGSISVSSVAGNIVITANAIIDETEEPSDTYTNLVKAAVSSDGVTIFNESDTPGYMNGTYASAPHTGPDDNCVTTGFIWMPTGVNVIYVKGATWDTTNSHCRIHIYSTLGSSSGLAHNIKATESTTIFNIETLGDNYYKFVVNNASAVANRWYCISLVGTGANLIITHDKPIG